MTARLTYVPAGFILGAAFPLCALVFAHLSGAGPAETNFAAYASQAQAGQPLYYLLDLAPLLLAFLGLCIGAKQDAAQRLATVLRREVNKKSEALARVANDLETRKRLEM